tara:strand:+ start:1591 stop:1695 length:105 start_codon:yes stop_codon:yes gene_type:complete
MEKKIKRAWKDFHKLMKSGRINKVVKMFGMEATK